MKKKFLVLMLLPVIVCALFAVHSFTTTSATHAATLQAQVIAASTPLPDTVYRVTCDNSPQVKLYTDYNPETGHTDKDCFAGNGGDYVKIYNVDKLFTGNYEVTWNWTDCNGKKHLSSKGPNTTLTAANAGSNKFAGYNVMCEITYLAVSFV